MAMNPSFCVAFTAQTCNGSPLVSHWNSFLSVENTIILGNSSSVDFWPDSNPTETAINNISGRYPCFQAFEQSYELPDKSWSTRRIFPGSSWKNPTNPKKIDRRYLHCIVMLRATQIAQSARVLPYFWAAKYGSNTHVNTCFLCALRGERRGDEQRAANFKATEWTEQVVIVSATLSVLLVSEKIAFILFLQVKFRFKRMETSVLFWLPLR